MLKSDTQPEKDQESRDTYSMKDYSTKKISSDLIEEITDALKNIRGWGSIEIYVQDYKVVQITERNIRKTTSNVKTGRIVKIGA